MGILPIVAELMDAAGGSVAALRERISNVRYGPIDPDMVGTIYFELDNEPYLGRATGRNADVFLYLDGRDSDKAWALRTLLDGEARKIT